MIRFLLRNYLLYKNVINLLYSCLFNSNILCSNHLRILQPYIISNQNFCIDEATSNIRRKIFECHHRVLIFRSARTFSIDHRKTTKQNGHAEQLCVQTMQGTDKTYLSQNVNKQTKSKQTCSRLSARDRFKVCSKDAQ